MKYKTLIATVCYLAAMVCFALILRGAEPPKLTDAQKLAVREAQVEVLALQAQAAQIEAALKPAQEKLRAAVEVAQKVCGGAIGNDLSCIAPPAKAKEAPKK